VAKLKKWIFRGAGAITLLAAIIFAVPYIRYYLTHESTDDAYVDGTIVPVSSEVKGKVVQVFITDNQRVTAAQPLVEIDCTDYSAATEQKRAALAEAMAEERKIQAAIAAKTKELEEARAQAAAAEAEEKLQAREKERYAALLAKKFISQSQYDHVESQWQVNVARNEAARATIARIVAELEGLQAQQHMQQARIKQAAKDLELTALELKKTVVPAPITGRIAKKSVDPGKYVQPGQSLCAVVDEDNVWVVANFKETQLTDMRKGQPVEIRVDAYPGVVFRGPVDSFQPGTGAVFSLLPPENATGNFVKVVQRVPVKILLDTPPDPRHPLWPGLSVIPYVNVSVR